MTLSLIDHFIHKPDLAMVDETVGRYVHAIARKTIKFELTASAVEMTAATLRNEPGRLLAKPCAPFPLTWIEWDHSQLLNAIGAKSTMPSNTQRHHGILIDEQMVYMISRNPDETHHATVWPIRFVLNTPTQNPTISTELQFWGSSYRAGTGNLSDLHSMEFITKQPHVGSVLSTMQNIVLKETVGDLRIVLGILHTINRKGAVVDGATTGFVESTFLNGKRVVRHAKGSISVDLTLERPVEYVLSQPTGITRELLQRRGGYAENHAARVGTFKGCDHVWTAVESFGHAGRPNERYLCHACGGKKWKRRAFQRDPEASRSYRVEAFA